MDLREANLVHGVENHIHLLSLHTFYFIAAHLQLISALEIHFFCECTMSKSYLPKIKKQQRWNILTSSDQNCLRCRGELFLETLL